MSKQDEQQMVDQADPKTDKSKKTTDDGILSNGNVRWMSPAYIKQTKYKVSSEMEKLGSEFESLTSVNQMPNFIEKCFQVLDSGKLTGEDDEEVLSDLEPNLFIYTSDEERKKWIDSYKAWVDKRSNLVQRFANASVASSGRKFVEGIDLNNF